MAKSENGQRDTDRQSDLAVMDANEYKQKRRLERILDAMDNIQDSADEAWTLYVQGEISRDARNITIQRAVKNAIRECYKLLLDHERSVEDGPGRYWAGDPSDPVGQVSVPGGDDIAIYGLKDFLESKTFYRESVTETVSRRNKPPKEVTETIEYTLPGRVSFRAYMRLKEFLDEVHDMEITFEEIDDERPFSDWREEYGDGV